MKSEVIPITSPLAMTAITPTASNIPVHTPATGEHTTHHVYSMTIAKLTHHHYTNTCAKKANAVAIHQCRLSFWALGGAQG